MSKWLIIPILLAVVSEFAFASEPSIENLSGLEQFRQAFQKDAGKLRIVAILSPT
jgi:hypothetical protein